MRADLAYGNTRLRARRGELLRDADYERLLGEDVDGLLGALEDTPYAPDVEAARGDDGLRRLHQTIGSHLSRSLEEMRSFYTDRARRLVDVLLSRFDLHNVLAVLRAKAGTQGPADDALVRVGWLVEPLAGEILGQNELAGAVDLLARSTPDREQAGALRAAFGEYEVTEDLAALERAVVTDHRRAPSPASGPRDRTPRRCCGSRGAPSTSATSWSPSACAMRWHPAPRPSRRRPPRGCRAGRSRSPCSSRRSRLRLPPRSSEASPTAGWQPPLQRWAASGDLTALERELERRCIADAAALFVTGDPLAIDVPVAFTAAKETEARNLRLLGEASVRGIDAESVRRELLWPEARP